MSDGKNLEILGKPRKNEEKPRKYKENQGNPRKNLGKIRKSFVPQAFYRFV